MEIWDIKNFQTFFVWLRQLDWANLWNSFFGLIILIVFVIVLFVILAAVVWVYRRLVKWLGPPYKKVEPETLYFVCILGQVLPWYIMNSKIFYDNIFGDILERGPLRKITAWFHLGSYRFILWPIPWPLAYIKPDNWDGSTPQYPVDIRQDIAEVIVDSAELLDNSLARTLTLKFKRWDANPFHRFFGRAPEDAEGAFKGIIRGVAANILRGLTEKEVDTQNRLQKELDAALLNGGRWWNWFGNRPADILARTTCFRIGGIFLENIERPKDYVEAAAKERLFNVFLRFIEKTRDFTKEQFDLLRIAILSSGGGGHGTEVEVLTKLGGSGGGEEKKAKK